MEGPAKRSSATTTTMSVMDVFSERAIVSRMLRFTSSRVLAPV